VKAQRRTLRQILLTGGSGLLLGMVLFLGFAPIHQSRASPLSRLFHGRHACNAQPCPDGDWEGTWYWLRSPEEEKRVISGLYNRYCIRCHGVDGRGIWDIPGVPDFTNAAWQTSRSDAALARIIVEGRGAVMPPFRGTLTLEEAWALARYLRTFLPGTEVPRPDFKAPAQ
jgi:hypothetical protein